MAGEAAELPNLVCITILLPSIELTSISRRTVFDDNEAGQQAQPTGNPPPPAPGAVPQAGGPPAPPNVNRPAGNNPLGNPLDLVNRLLGPQPQVDNNAQFQQNRPPPAGNNANAGARNTAPDGTSVLIHYEVQYQGRRPQPGQTQPTGGLTPVPQVFGYQGSARAENSRALHNGQSNSVAETPTSAQPTGTSDAIPSPSTVSSQAAAAQADTPAESDSETSSEDEDGPTKETLSPMDAARQAALRRFGNGPLSPPNNTAEAAVRGPSFPKPTPTTHLPEKPSPTPAPASSAAPDSPASSSSTAAVAPALIPLHDILFSSDPNNIPSMIRVPDVPVVSESRSLGNIPSHLNDEQLDRLDRLTREAIDERLLVLEGVSNTVYRCIDDLMRMRSTLPTVQSPDRDNGQMSSRREEKQPERKDIARQSSS